MVAAYVLLDYQTTPINDSAFELANACSLDQKPLCCTLGPRVPSVWYRGNVSGTHTVVVGDRGRLVVPAEVRERAGLVEGTTLVLFETPSGIVLMTRAQLRDRVRDELSGLDLVGDLLAERRATAASEDAA